MKRFLSLLLAGLLFLTGCAAAPRPMDGPDMLTDYRQIDQETARQMMERDDDHVVVDVRRLDEYESGHIPGAICIPNESIETEPPEELPSFDQILLIYCRSGRRSKEAARKLFDMGYTEVYEFGGIIDWTGETVSGQSVLLTLESNPTTGFLWAAAQDQELFDVQTGYTALPTPEPMTGTGGRQRFLLTPKEPGTVRLSFRYSRPWEPADADPQFDCVFEISEDLTVSMTGDGSARAAEQGYEVSVRVY